jgi:phosphatidate cytidylyltransferase
MPSADSATPSGGPSKARIFFRRLVSTVVLWAVVLSALFSPSRLLSDYVFLGIMMSLAGVGLWEFYGLVERRGLVCFRRWGVLGGLLLMVSTFIYLSGETGPERGPAKANDFEMSILIVLVLGLCLWQLFVPHRESGLLAMATTLFGLLYVPWLLNFIQKINYYPGIDGNGPFYVLFFILVTKMSDTGAYVIGSLIGRHKMIPRISPGKTWEGLGGAMLFSLLGSLLFFWVAPERLAGMTWAHSVILGALLGAAAVVGDLVESMLKREAGVKDSGQLFPGIGGILDVLDSLLFNAPLMYLYLRHVLVTG